MKEVKYKLISLDELTALIDKSLPIMIDSETIGLYGKIRLFQFYQATEAFTIDGERCAMLVEYPDPFALTAILTDLHCVGFNLHYDISTIQDNLGKHLWMPDKFDDLFLLARLHYHNKMEFSLDKVLTYLYGFDPYEGIKSDMHKADWSVPILSEEQKLYSASDVVFLHDLWDAISKEENLSDINYKLDIITLRFCLDFQNNGLPLDEERLLIQYEENCKRIDELAVPINVNSYIQVRQYINSQLSNDEGLALLSKQGNEKAAAVRETRKLIKQNSFLSKFQNTMRDNKIFGKFKPSARSGRLTSDDQNLQQLPRKLKGVFGVEEGGDYVLVYSDFAQIQLRGACVVSNEKAMEALFRNKEDLHNYVASWIFGEDFTKDDRQVSKTANFSLLFGAGTPVFQSILLTDADMLLQTAEADKIRTGWRRLWKQLMEWQEKGIKDWRKHKHWETPLGRRYVAKLMTDQLAMQIQGFEAEVAKLALYYMWYNIKELNEDIKLCNWVHDSYIFICPNDPEVYKPLAELIGNKMQEAWFEMSKCVAIKDLPMPVKVRVGYNWGDIESDIYIYEYKKD